MENSKFNNRVSKNLQKITEAKKRQESGLPGESFVTYQPLPATQLWLPFWTFKNKKSKKSASSPTQAKREDASVKCYAYTFISKQTSFLMVTPATLNVLYDEIFIFTSSGEIERVEVHFEGLEMVDKQLFKKMSEIHYKWAKILYNLSDEAAMKVRKGVSYLSGDGGAGGLLEAKAKVEDMVSKERENFFFLPSTKILGEKSNKNLEKKVAKMREKARFMVNGTRDGDKNHHIMKFGDKPVISKFEDLVEIWTLDEDLCLKVDDPTPYNIPLQTLEREHAQKSPKNHQPATTQKVTYLDLQNSIIGVDYNKKANYTIDMILLHPLTTKAIEMKNQLSKFYDLRTDSKRAAFDNKFGMTSEAMRYMSVREFLDKVPNQDNKNDFAVFREIDKFKVDEDHPWEAFPRDKLYFVNPLIGIMGADYTMDKVGNGKGSRRKGPPSGGSTGFRKAVTSQEMLRQIRKAKKGSKNHQKNSKNLTNLDENQDLQTPQNAQNGVNSKGFSSRNSKKNRKAGFKALILASRHLNLRFYTVDQMNNWSRIPSIITNFKRRLLSKVFLGTYKLKTENLAKPILWTAFQTSSACKIFNYECLETLGDSVLKFLSIYFLVAVSTSRDSEGKLTRIKGNMVCNQRLSVLAKLKMLYKFLHHQREFFDSWRPPMINSDNRGENRRQRAKEQVIHNHQIADLFEACLGGVFMDNFDLVQSCRYLIEFNFFFGQKRTDRDARDGVGALDRGFETLKAIFERKPYLCFSEVIERPHSVDKWFFGEDGMERIDLEATFAELWTMTSMSRRVKKMTKKLKLGKMRQKLGSLIQQELESDGLKSAKSSRSSKQRFKPISAKLKKFIYKTFLPSLEGILGYTFKNKDLLRLALTPEWSKKLKFEVFDSIEDLGKNLEKLEFLGDSIFELCVIASIFRQNWAQNSFFTPSVFQYAKIFLLSNANMAIFASMFQIHNFVLSTNQEVVAKVHEAGDRLRKISTQKKCKFFLSDGVGIPKNLSDIWESLAAAVLLDGGWEALGLVFGEALKPFISYFNKFKDEVRMNFKSEALMITQKDSRISFEVRLIDQADPDWLQEGEMAGAFDGDGECYLGVVKEGKEPVGSRVYDREYEGALERVYFMVVSLYGERVLGVNI